MRRGWLQLAVGAGAVGLAWGVWLTWPHEEGPPFGTTVDKPAARTPHVTLIRGRAVDPAGAPIAGAGIRLLGERETLATSGEDGFFEIVLPRLDKVLDTSDPDRSTLRWRRITEENRDEVHELVLAPAVSLTGQIVDVNFRGLPGEVYVAVPESVHKRMPSELTADTQRRMYRFPTDSTGHFELEQIPFGPQTTIHGCVDGYTMRKQVLVPNTSKHGLRLVVIRSGQEQPDGPHLRGLVLDPAGKPARDARVLFCGVDAQSDVAGEFVLELHSLARIPLEAEIIVTKRGHQPRVEPRYGELVHQGYPEPGPVTLVLGEPALSISGTVVGPEGKPFSLPLDVEVLDKTPLVQDEHGVREYAEDMGSLEHEMIDPTGEFVLTGLAPRRYTLAVTSSELRTRKIFDGVAAGSSGLVLQIEPGPRFERVLGIVRGPSGEPLHDVMVSLDFSGNSTGTSFGFDHQWTDTEGRFELKEVPGEHVELFFRGDTILPRTVPVESIDTPLELIVNTRLSSTFAVWIPTWIPTDAPWGVLEFQLLSEGQPAPLYSDRNSDKHTEERFWVVPGNQIERFVAAGSYTAVFSRQGTVVSTETVELQPGAATPIWPRTRR